MRPLKFATAKHVRSDQDHVVNFHHLLSELTKQARRSVADDEDLHSVSQSVALGPGVDLAVGSTQVHRRLQGR